MKKTLEKPEGTIKNGQSRDTNNTGHMIQNEDKQRKRHNIEIYKDEQHGPHQQTQRLPMGKQFLFLLKHPSCYPQSSATLDMNI